MKEDDTFLYLKNRYGIFQNDQEKSKYDYSSYKIEINYDFNICEMRKVSDSSFF